MSIKSQRKKEKREARKEQEEEIILKILDVLNQNDFIEFYYNHKENSMKKCVLDFLNKNNVKFSFCSKEVDEAIVYFIRYSFPESFFDLECIDQSE